jgi:NADPH:quinone reductase-like Zn-dependent oxidoreductase
MRAVRFHEHGGPEVLRYEEDVPIPEPGPGDVLIRVRACALNHLDLWQRRGIPGVTLPHAPGSDISGEVARSEATLYSEGQRVLLQPGLSCGRCAACLSGQDNFCSSYDIIGYRSEGGYGEFVRVPAANVLAIPDRVGFYEAAAFPLTFLTAWHMLVTRAQLQPGETVLVLAAGSGVGQAAIQIARLLGARVIATAGADDKLERARSLGADAGINHYTQDIADEVRQLTGRRGVDVVCEHVGQATWDKCVKSLARGGRLVTCGATTGPSVSIDERVLFARQISLLGSYMGTKGELLRAAAFFFAGQLAPVVDKVYPLAAAADAHRRLEQKEQFGKIVLEV